MDRSPLTPSRVIKIIFALAVILVAVIIGATLVGSTRIGFMQGLKGIFLAWHSNGPFLKPSEETILFSIRLPRVLFAGLVGAALSSAGVVFQALLRNPLADPYILGISGGAAVGAIVGIVAISSLPFCVPFLAFLGAIFTVVLVFVIGGTRRGLNSNTLLLAGVIINAFFSAIIMFLVSLSGSSDLHSITFWLMGDLSVVSLGEIMLGCVFLFAGFFIVYAHARTLNMIVMGEETALQLGINVEKTKIILLLASSVITAVAVAFSGIIGFVGLIIPHIMRMMLGSDHRLLLPASFLFGASFLIIADTIARTIIPYTELPVGVITAVCGAPYFIYLLRRRAV
ncbi:MAG: iron chelate uptake ABC transporter family permease subunit [Deltaproteobacteria bacterium]|nr:iron chelate uptake ABC transporter family permease subunit [Deltaproteobacteria bacterium]